MELTSGFINLNKPSGISSAAAVSKIKRLTGLACGHMGTLDPLASGVLPVAVGKATRLFDFLTDKVKRYRAFFTFGKTTDTLDSYGAVTQTTGSVPSEEQVARACQALTGEIMQTPPAYSAISVGGVRAYKLARSGQDVQLKSRKVTVYAISLLGRQGDTFVFDVTCSAGTYIRALARDVAEACGTVGYMSALIRLSSGCFDIADAYTLNEVRSLGQKCLLPVSYVLSDVETLCLPDQCYDDLDFGRYVACAPFEELKKVYCKGQLFGLGCCTNGRLNLKYYLKNI